MTLINEADKVYIGTAEADAVYLGADKVWPTGFSPDSIAGLVYWMDASMLGLANNADVNPWTNLGSGGNWVKVGPSYPKYRTATLNGQGVVRFTASEGRLRSPVAWNTSGRTVYDYELFYIVRLWGTTTGRAFTVSYPNSNWLAGYHTSAQDWLYDNGQTLGSVAWPGAGPLPWKIYGASSATGPDGTRFSVNGTAIGRTPAKASFGWDNVLCLSGYSPTGTEETMDMDVAEVLIYDHELTSGERTTVETYLQTKWGL